MLRRLCFWLLAIGLTLPLLGSGVEAATGGAPAVMGQVGLPPSPRGPIYQENQRPGTTSWQSATLARAATKHRPTRRDERPRPTWPGLPTSPTPADAFDTWADTCVRGYADRASINRGESIRLMVSTARPTVTLNIYRVGWYGGAGMSLKLTVPSLPGQNQPVPAPDSNGMVAANWTPSYTLQTDASWVSGVYLVKLTAPNCDDGYLHFVVRDDTQPSDILYQLATNTYQAYNNWGGKSLYDYQSPTGRANRVSYDRPYADWGGAGMFFDGDFNMIRFLESQGYNLTYATSVDTEANPNLLNNHKLFLSNWHDEYWSRTMRTNIRNARDAGKHLAFFDSNNIYWQVRFDSAGGVPNRILICYKDDPDAGPPVDPIVHTDPSLDTTQWRWAPVNQPENALLGIMFDGLFDYGNSYPWVVMNANHWVYTGTSLQNGQTIPGLVGYEFDSLIGNGLTPANLVELARSPVVDLSEPNRPRSATHNATIYTASSGALVFSAGTNYFPWKVDTNDYQAHGVEPNAQQIVRNVLNGMIGSTPPTITSIPPATATRTATASPTRTLGPTSTPTRTATPTPAPTCNPRPQVAVTTTPGSPGRLTVSVATSSAAHDYLEGIQFGNGTNALIDAGPLVGIPGNATITTPPQTYQYTFTVRRTAGAQSATVPMTVVTACGSWPTFVGGGPGAFQAPS